MHNWPALLQVPTTLVEAACIPAMSYEDMAQVARVADVQRVKPQIKIRTRHQIHGKVYIRTITIPKNVMITGVPVKIATSLIMWGDLTVWLGATSRRYRGYKVLPASAHRQQIFGANRRSHLSMIFATTAKSVKAAEREFTDDFARLQSRRFDDCNDVVITGE